MVEKKEISTQTISRREIGNNIKCIVSTRQMHVDIFKWLPIYNFYKILNDDKTQYKFLGNTPLGVIGW
ncbi:hypothetical protein APR43_15670 [Flavobacterium sp. NLM]|nr:hypothetical protein AKO67_09290 [Flavobacterium sp. VMW]OWU89932.1 hypothetical protein APR43_15670 [Flavobacterium sp. NLM]